MRIALAGDVIHNARRERLFRDRPRRGFRLGGRIRLRQEHYGAGRDGPVAPAAVARRRQGRARRPGDPECAGGRDAAPARQAHRHDLPGADDGAQSAVAGRQADRRDVRAARGRGLERGDGPRRGGAAPGARALARAAHQGLPAPAFGRHAPARDDRHCARLRTRPADRRRADHGARRHGAGRDHRPDGRALCRHVAPPS